eukprot:2251955-Pleurochrysis_carterae.AAC.1
MAMSERSRDQAGRRVTAAAHDAHAHHAPHAPAPPRAGVLQRPARRRRACAPRAGGAAARPRGTWPAGAPRVLAQAAPPRAAPPPFAPPLEALARRLSLHRAVHIGVAVAEETRLCHRCSVNKRHWRTRGAKRRRTQGAKRRRTQGAKRCACAP